MELSFALPNRRATLIVLWEKVFRVSFYVRLRNLKDQFGRNTFAPHYLTFKVGRLIAPHPRERIGLMNIKRELRFDGREMRMVNDVFRRGVRSAARVGSTRTASSEDQNV
jgi:hypothetical protein